MNTTLLESNLKDFKLIKRGKVRDIYEVDSAYLIVATDRISAFDVVLPNGIPHKGEILTALSLFWFTFSRGIIPNHTLDILPKSIAKLSKTEEDMLEGRSMLVKKAVPLPVECIVRGYLSGSAWKEYQVQGKVTEIYLPTGLKESAKLSEPIFTPSTKAETGHDVNITSAQLQNIIGTDMAQKLGEISLDIYRKASEYADDRGIIIADTKFEFGLFNGDLILIDELLTPDSSRFWSKAEYQPGKPQPSFDKQFVRDYLERIRWDKNPPAPELPPDVVAETTNKYLEAQQRLIGANSSYSS